jgi:toxin ParE1/3/4
MAKVVVSERADADLDQILTYLTENAGYTIAARYDAAFEALFFRLADHRASGAPRLEFGPYARIALVRPFVVIYDHIDDTVIVVRVLHGKRDIARELSPR